MTRHAAALLCLALVLAGALFLGLRTARLWGDEKAYVALTHPTREAPWPERFRALLPGEMPLRWWPPLPFSVYGVLAGPRPSAADLDDLDVAATGLPAAMRPFWWRALALNLALLGCSCGLLYALCLTLGVGPWLAAAACALVALNPRTLFYAPALWPELLHQALFLGGLLGLVRYLRWGSLRALAVTSAIWGYAALTKRVVEPYALLLLPLLVWPARRSVGSMLVTLLVFAAPYGAITGLQRWTNAREHGAWVLSTNTWVNVETGLVPDDAYQDLGYAKVLDRYHAASAAPLEREVAARGRVFEHLQSTSLAALAARVGENYGRQILDSFFALGVSAERWRGVDPANASWAIVLGQTMSVLLTACGALGVVWLGWRSPTHAALALFLIYYWAALGVVGHNPRFFVQSMPLMAVFAALLSQRWSRHARGPAVV
ncbi:MAG: hypothetical protein AAF628_05055 [Planctomycetota bacterium]